MRLPPYYKQESMTLPDPVANFIGFTGIIPKGGTEPVHLGLDVGETGLVSIVDTPVLSPAHDGLFYVARQSSNTWQINTLASRQVDIKVVGDNLVIENKGTTPEKYKWSVVHLI